MNKLMYLYIAALLIIEGNPMQAVDNSTKLSTQKNVASERTLKVRYTNYRGETAVREIVPQEIYWGKTEYHPEEQWLLRVWDVEKGAERVYAFKDIKEIMG
jgi:hypothetical protein